MRAAGRLSGSGPPSGPGCPAWPCEGKLLLLCVLRVERTVCTSVRTCLTPLHGAWLPGVESSGRGWGRCAGGRLGWFGVGKWASGLPRASERVDTLADRAGVQVQRGICCCMLLLLQFAPGVVACPAELPLVAAGMLMARRTTHCLLETN